MNSFIITSVISVGIYLASFSIAIKKRRDYNKFSKNIYNIFFQNSKNWENFSDKHKFSILSPKDLKTYNRITLQTNIIAISALIFAALSFFTFYSGYYFSTIFIIIPLFISILVGIRRFKYLLRMIDNGSLLIIRNKSHFIYSLDSLEQNYLHKNFCIQMKALLISVIAISIPIIIILFEELFS